MSILAGQSENGWKKKILKGDLISYQTILTHISSSASNQVTGLFPSEVIKHLYKQFSNLYVYISWGAGAKTTTFNLLLLNNFQDVENNDVFQTREISATASRANTEYAFMIIPKNLYSSDGTFIETSNIISPHMIFQDLSNSHPSSSGTNTVTIDIVFASEDTYGLKKIGDNI